LKEELKKKKLLFHAILASWKDVLQLNIPVCFCLFFVLKVKTFFLEINDNN